MYVLLSRKVILEAGCDFLIKNDVLPVLLAASFSSVQLQLLILENGTSIPVTAEEGVSLLTSLDVPAALVPFGYSVVQFQVGTS